MNMSSTNGSKPVSNLLGKTFDRLTVTDYLGIGRHDKHYWLCTCVCGGEVTLNTSRITGKDNTKSCGCLAKENLLRNRADPTKHGLHKHKLYAIYYSMLYRCNNPNAQRWKYYGSKGITVSWTTFQEFYDWAMNNGYINGLSIDRIDSNGNYEPANCQWLTVSDNTRKAHLGKSRRNEITT